MLVQEVLVCLLVYEPELPLLCMFSGLFLGFVTKLPKKFIGQCFLKDLFWH